LWEICKGGLIKISYAYFVGIFWLQEHSSQQPQTDDFLLALVFANVTGERVVILAVIEASRDALQRLVAPLVFLEKKAK